MNERSIFMEALEKDNLAERGAYLDEACGTNAALRQRVEALLQSHEKAGSFLGMPVPERLAEKLATPQETEEMPGESPDADNSESAAASSSLSTIHAPAVTEQPGATIGPYKLLQQIGEGGMGTVFMAEQTEPIQRKVALKIIKPGLDSRQVNARFEAERQALAMMDHVNIARVLDGGATENGRPYFVMELVHGVPITKYCDDNYLTPRERLELFVPVCQAIQHAHQKGIIHRDIKPSNVMITLYDGRPVPKVIDFGIAKATEQKLTEQTLFTQYGMMVGTLEYMSPEQAEMSGLGVDTRSDIYSLGVLLYELLTGSTPLERKRFKDAAYGEILRIIKEEEPQKPSTRLSDSGEALASISAQRQMEPAKLTRLVRGELDWIVMKTLEKDRNRRYATANGLALDVQRYLHDEPVQACPPSALYRFRKFARRNKAGLAVAALILCFIALLGGSIGWVVRDRAARQAKVDQDQEERRQQIERQVSRALDEAALFQGQARWPEALAAARRAEGLLAGVTGTEQLGQRARALLADLTMVVRLEEIRTRPARDDYALGQRPNTEYARAFKDYGIDIDVLAPREAAERIRGQNIRLELAMALDDWAEMRSRVNKPGQRSWQELLEIAAWADPDEWRSRCRDAMRLKDRPGLEELTRTVPIKKVSPGTLHLLSSALRSVGAIEQATALLERAQREYPGDLWLNEELGWFCVWEIQPPRYEDGLRFTTVALALRPRNQNLLFALRQAYRGLNRWDEAITVSRKMIELNFDSALAHYLLGGDLWAAGAKDGAIEAYRQAIALDPKYTDAYVGLGRSLSAKGNRQGAIEAYRQAIVINPKSAIVYNNLGNVLLANRDLDRAVEAYRQALAIDPKYAKAHNNLGSAVMAKGDRQGALAAYRRAVALDPKLALAQTNLGHALRDERDWEGAIKAYRQAIVADPKDANRHYDLALELAKTGDRNGAIEAYRKAIVVNPKHARAHINLGGVLHGNGDVSGAIAAYRQGIAINPRIPVAHYNLGNALRTEGDREAAIASYEEAVRLDPKYAEAFVNLASVLWDKDLLVEAAAAYSKALGIKPDVANGLVGRGITYRMLGQIDNAIADFTKAIEQKVDLGRAHYHLGIALQQKKDLDGASAAFRQSLQLQPDCADCQNKVGEVLRATGKLDEASAAFKAAILLKQDLAIAHFNLGRALQQKDDLDGALEAHRKVIRLQPNYAAAHFQVGTILVKKGAYYAAILALQESIRLNPRAAAGPNELAWLLATCPDANFRTPGPAVELAKKAVELAPNAGNYWNTLGAAHYRAGNWREALAALEKSMALRKGGITLDWCLLAMAHWRLGNRAEARKWYDQAVQWMEKNQPANEELRRFRTEATELLEIKEK